MFWRDFRTQKEAIEAIQGIINPKPFLEPFESELISDLVVERHYFCSPRGIRPSRFRKIPGGNPYKFEGDFSNAKLSPPISWHSVSWLKCLKKQPTDWDRIVRAMRDRIQSEKLAYRASLLVCENCMERPPDEVHHKLPSFHQITEGVKAEVSNEHISECLGDWNWFLKDDFALPEGNPITQLFDRLNQKATLEALCKPCHNRTKKKVS